MARKKEDMAEKGLGAVAIKIIFGIIILSTVVGVAWYSYLRQGVDPLKQAYSPSKPGAVSSIGPSEIVFEAGILIGNSNAPVTIEEYTDFLCPACARFAASTLTQIEEDYIKTGKVKMLVYILPPQQLGWAALCSQEQNKFIEFSSYLFIHQKQITRERYIRNLAINAGLDIQKFDACYASNKYREKVDKWAKDSEKRKVVSIPTFFINGEELVGAKQYDEFKKIIDRKLGQAR